MRYILTLLAAALMLSGCAVQAVPPDKLGRIKSVAVISALGDDLYRVHRGFTLLTDSVTHIKVDWDLDDYMKQQLTALLSPHFEIRNIDYDISPLLVASEKKVFSVGGEHVESAVKRTAPRGIADALIITSRASLGEQSRSIDHFGILSFGGFLVSDETHAYVIYQIIVVDGHTLDPIAVSYGRSPVSYTRHFGGYPTPRIPASTIRRPFPELSKEEQDSLRPLFTGVIDESLGYTLRKMELIPPVEAKPATSR